MSIEKRLERVEAILDARGLDWDHPRVEDDHFVGAGKMVVEEPPKKWRRLTDEFVQPGDWANAKVNRQDVDPPDEGWIPADPCYFGKRACTLSMYFARPVVEEPAKEQAEEQPKKWRILEPGEVVCSGDWICARSNLPSDPPNGLGWKLQTFSTGQTVSKHDECVFARPVVDEPAKVPEPPAEPMPSMESYRPVNDCDIGKVVEVQNSALEPWRECTLLEIDWDVPYGFLCVWLFCRHGAPVVATQWRFARIKIDDPAREPEHPVVPMPDPGEGYRILSKNPPEELTPEIDDWWEYDEQRWRGVFPLDLTAQHPRIWYRRKIEVAKQPEPAWEPKVGDWVRVTRPENWEKFCAPFWLAEMHQFDGKVGQIERESGGHFRIRGFVGSNGTQHYWHRDWLSPVEPPAKDKPAEPEYREPVLPADGGKYCQFSDDGVEWRSGWLNGWGQRSHQWISHSGGHWRHCRIKKDA